jgi:O-antigen/teichoic acid export membrane protein
VGPAIAFRYLTALTAGALWALLATPFGPEAMLGGLLLASESIIAVQFGVLLAADRLGLYGCVLVGQRGVALAILSVGGSGTSLVAAYAVAAAVGATAMSAVARRQLRRDATRLVGSDVAAVLREGRPFFVHSLGAQLANLDTPIVGAVAGDVVAGVYGLPSRLTNAVGLLATSSASVLLRESSAAGADELVLRRLIRDAAVLVGLIAAGLGALALVAEPLVVHLFGEDYRDAVTPLRLVLLAVAVASANTVVASILQGTGRAVRTGRAVLFGTIVGLGAVAVGALVGDATGAGVGLVVMQLVIAFGLVMPNPPLGRRSRPGTPEA